MTDVLFSPIRLSDLEVLIEKSIRRVLAESNHNNESDQWLDVDQAAEYTRSAKQTIYQQVHKSEIPHHKKGKKLYFLKSELDIWLKEGRRKTNAELSVDATKFLRKKTVFH
ncbi:helix-turn-helix domain-containing protein [Cytophagaceae bacterium YF14B1]|uniref:Helix-turn-helix domain-containing protein n=1 Tax=Xanthocytophaga flava TaxID=3048013 RepID=A0AAE3QQV7_9BACT|nr:helix-turn-helix domain-containing protein [Xanthocytophaga flavus]MDJ1481753.1 helix-turn-helix domain-containing protein [Xanthocytophaga flavus]